MDQYTEKEWKALRNRLTLFAHKNFGSYLSFQDIEDIVSEAILDTYTGHRNWPSESHPNLELFVFVCGVIRSKVSHAWEKAVKLTYIEDNVEEILSLAHPTASAEQQAIYHELCNQMLGSIRDESLVQLLGLIADTPDLKPGEMAHLLNKPIEVIRNDLKRLRRILNSLEEERR